MPADRDEPNSQGAEEVAAAADVRDRLPADERALLEAFDRLRPQGTVRWNFDDAVRRLAEPEERPGRATPWSGLPADLWERGRGTKATERVMGDVIKIVAQDLTEYTDRAVDESRALSGAAEDELRRATLDAVRFLSARVDRLEWERDPLGFEAAELNLPSPDTTAWHGAVSEWVSPRDGAPVLIGELGDSGLASVVAQAGRAVDGVDPRGREFWAGLTALGGFGDSVTVSLAEVADHLRGLPASCRSGVVLSGCVDRAGLADKVALVDETVRVLVPGGSLVVLTTDQEAWDAGLDPVRRDLLPGRPLHPEAWLALLGHRGLTNSQWHPAPPGTVHALVTETAR